MEYCTSLTELNLWGNQISDLSPLSSLTSLTWLYLYGNQISDISPLSSLTSLTELYLWDNQISDISPLSSLTSLTRLYLGGNQISDIEPLVNNTGLSEGDMVDLTGNPLSLTSFDEYIPALEARGVTVYWVTFPDANLEAAIREAIGKPVGDIYASDLVGLTNLDAYSRGIADLTGMEYCTSLTWLNLNVNQISDISPLSSLTSLTSLGLGSNQISDISPLSSLTSLTELYSCWNQISDIWPLSSLTSLSFLDLGGNQISDIEPLVNNPGMASGDILCLLDNPLNSNSVNTCIPALQGRGVTVYFNQPTSVSLVSYRNPSTFGGLVTFSVTVKSTVIPSAGIPTGTVEFWDGGTLLGSTTLNAYGRATFRISSLGAGTHTITAIYRGDANFLPSASAALPQVVQKRQPSTRLRWSAGAPVHGQSVTFTATITSAAGTPSGTVQFMDNGTNLGGPVPLSSGTATYITSDLSVGGHWITAVYSGDDNFTSSSRTCWRVVRKATTKTLVTSSSNPSTYGNAVTFTAAVIVPAPGAGTPSGTVTFKDRSTVLGTTTLSDSGVATFTTSSPLSKGTHYITAVYSGDGNFKRSTSFVRQVVT